MSSGKWRKGFRVSRIRIEGDVAFVELTRGKEAMVDLCDVVLVQGHAWYAWKDFKKRGGTWYAIAGKGLRMHCLIMGFVEGYEIDHKDRDGLNNTRRNLRRATQSQNLMNQAKRLGKSKHKGVSEEVKTGKWRARIQIKGSTLYLGLYGTEEGAAAAYNEAAKLYFDEYARLNEIAQFN